LDMAEDYPVKPILDQVNQAVINQLAAHGGPPIYTLTPEEARSVLLRAQSGSFRKPDAEVKDWKVSSGPYTLRLRTIRPHTAVDSSPVVIYFHGAGWVMGDSTTHDRLVRELAVGANATLVFVDYDRAPEHRYPVAIEEAYAATCYVSGHAEEFGVDAARLAVAGDSVGGNMATVVTLLAKQRSGPAIAGQLLFYPVTNADFETGSFKQFADGPWLTRAAMQWFWDQYLPDRSLRKNPTASPLLASPEQLAGLPRALIITAENDVLRDEGEGYGRKLIEAGVEVVTTRYNATIHDFVMLNALAQAAPTRAAVAQAVGFLNSVLYERPAPEAALVFGIPGDEPVRVDYARLTG
jgi:acetyl esterase